MNDFGERWPVRVIRSARSALDLRGSALALAASAPLWWVPGGFSRFVLATLLVTVVAVVVAAVARPVGALPRSLVVVGALGAGCFAVAALLGETPGASLVGRWPRYEGLPTLATYAGAAWVGARVTGRGPAATRRLHGAVAATVVVLAGFSVLDVVGVSPLGPGTEARSGSVLGNATDQGAVAMMAALVLAGAVVRARAWRGHLLELTGLAAALVTVAVSGSRTALGLTLVGLVVVVALGLLVARGAGVGVGAGVGAGVGIGGAALALLGVAALLVPTTRDRLLGLGTAEGRLEQWRLSLGLVRDHPVLGLGGSRYVDAFLAREDAAFVAFTGPQRIADSPHSVVLQVLLAGGVVLLAVALAGLVVVARRTWTAVGQHPEVAPVAVAVAAYLALLCVNFTTAGPTCFAALLLGAVVAVPVDLPVDLPVDMQGEAPAPGAGGPAPDRAAWVVGVPATVLALVLGAAVVGEVRLQDAVEAADRREVDTAAALLDETGRWRPWDVDVDVIGARVLAGETALGRSTAAPYAEALARAATAHLPDSYESLVALGVALSAQGRVAEAVDVLDRAVALAPQRPDGWVQRSIALAGLARPEEALADLGRARAIVPDSPVVRRLTRQVERLQRTGPGAGG